MILKDQIAFCISELKTILVQHNEALHDIKPLLKTINKVGFLLEKKNSQLISIHFIFRLETISRYKNTQLFIRAFQKISHSL